MKRALLALSITILAASSVAAQLKDPYAPIKSYAAKVLPKCPGGTLTLEPLTSSARNFTAFQLTLRSTDKYCGAQKYLLYSPTTQQVLLGSVIELPATAGKTVGDRVAAEASRLLQKQVTATVAPFPLPDGLKAVTITRATPYGAFSYHAFVDASEKFLIVGSRGSLKTDPVETIRTSLGVATAARRGNKASKVEILEISDFQCPTCAHAHSKLEPLIQQNLSKINYVRIDLPLFEHHEWAIPAAAAARAIQKVAPGKYWTYVDYIFKNQEDIGKRPFDTVIQEFAEDHDLDFAALKPIYASKSERQAILDQVSRAYALGIASTPTFVVNGQIMGFGPEGTFTVEAIKSAIGSATPAKSGSAKK
jgi:protein-disulfide isomerase